MKPRDKTTKIDPEQYWRLRALLRDVEAAQKAAQQQVDAAAGKAQEHMKMLGLRTDVNYKFDDDTTSLTLVATPPPAVFPGVRNRGRN